MCQDCSNILTEFYKRKGVTPSQMLIMNFRMSDDVMESAFKLPPKDALKHLKSKSESLITTEKWNEITSSAHDKAFTVAKVMSADMLQLIYDKVVKAKETGMTLRDFQKQLVPELQNAGWTGVTPGRLRVIYETNMQVTYSKEKYKGMMLVADQFPYWQYKQIERKNKRDEHSKWHNLVFRYDDPFWQSRFPPSAFGCKCSVVQLSEADIKSRGLTVSKGSDFDLSEPDLKVLEAWEPDTTKYVEGVKRQLEKFVGKPKEPVVEVKDKRNIKMITEREIIKRHNELTNDDDYLNEISKFEIGGIYNVPVYYLFPSSSNGEFDTAVENVENGKISQSDEPILAFVKFDRLIIGDGHHRFYQALKANKKFIKVRIEHKRLTTVNNYD